MPVVVYAPPQPNSNFAPLFRQAADAALAVLEEWMDSQPLSRAAQAPDKQKELAKLSTQAQVRTENQHCSL